VAVFVLGLVFADVLSKPDVRAQTDAAPSLLKAGACLEFDVQGTTIHRTKKLDAVEGHWFHSDGSWWNIEQMLRVAPKDCK
jgi:hypothetical protein